MVAWSSKTYQQNVPVKVNVMIILYKPVSIRCDNGSIIMQGSIYFLSVATG